MGQRRSQQEKEGVEREGVERVMGKHPNSVICIYDIAKELPFERFKVTEDCWVKGIIMLILLTPNSESPG